MTATKRPTQAVNMATNQRSSGKQSTVKASQATIHHFMTRTPGKPAMERARCASHAKGRTCTNSPQNGVLACPWRAAGSSTHDQNRHRGPVPEPQLGHEHSGRHRSMATIGSTAGSPTPTRWSRSDGQRRLGLRRQPNRFEANHRSGPMHRRQRPWLRCLAGCGPPFAPPRGGPRGSWAGTARSGLFAVGNQPTASPRLLC